MKVAALVENVLGPSLPLAFEAYDGSHTGPAHAPATVLIGSSAAPVRLVTSPGQLGCGRAGFEARHVESPRQH